MNVWLISIFEQTPVDNVSSTRFMNIADEALALGHRVTFFASTFKHNTKVQRYPETTRASINPSYQVAFIKSLSYRKNLGFKRIFSHYQYSKRLVREFRTHDLPDVIYIAFPPMSIAFEVSKWAAKKNIPVIIDVIDPWPDIFRAAFPKLPKVAFDILLSPMTWKLRFILKKVSGVTAISDQYIRWARNYEPRITNTLCAYPAVKLKDMQQRLHEIDKVTQRDPNKLRVIYAGSLASSYDMPTILGAAELLNKKYENQIEFVIAGAGPQEQMIREHEGRLSNLKFLGRLPKDELLKEYFLSDLGLIQHVKGATQSVTYKLFDLLASNLPILNSLESEMKDIILNNKVGLFNAPGDANQLAENIELLFKDREKLKTFKENGLRLTREQGDATVVYQRAVRFMESIVEKNRMKNGSANA
jgi:glycosyltransferase involved in cell wall biosynthesis